MSKSHDRRAASTFAGSGRADAHGGTTAIFTIVSRNYIAYAATLMQSLGEHHPDADRYVFLADDAYDFDDLDIPATHVPADQIGIEPFSEMIFRYTVIELNT